VAQVRRLQQTVKSVYQGATSVSNVPAQGTVSQLTTDLAAGTVRTSWSTPDAGG